MTAHASNPAMKFIDPKALMNIRDHKLNALLAGVGAILRSPRQCVLWSNGASAGVPLSPEEREKVTTPYVGLPQSPSIQRGVAAGKSAQFSSVCPVE